MDENLLERAVHAVRHRWPDLKPRFGAVLGSGWGDVVDALTCEGSMEFAEIPGLGRTGVEGHSGRLVRARIADLDLLVFQGRRHYYEGEGWTPVSIPIRVLKELGAEGIVLTNAAGGIRQDLKPGTLMLIEDHLNMMGSHPLIGRHNPKWGPRFPDQTHVYDPGMREIALATAVKVGEPIARGVYLALSGPCYETPAEIRAYRGWGADAVGMSTAPEAVLASAAGLKVLGISCITNLAAGISPKPLSHEEVAETSAAAMTRLVAFFTQLWQDLAASYAPGK